MPTHRTPGTTMMGAELESGLWERFRKFCKSRGESVRQHLEQAIRRHLANPPDPPVDPPLPPVTVPNPPKTRTRKPKSPS